MVGATKTVVVVVKLDMVLYCEVILPSPCSNKNIFSDSEAEKKKKKKKKAKRGRGASSSPESGSESDDSAQKKRKKQDMFKKVC